MAEQIGFEFIFRHRKPIRLMSVEELYDDMSQQIAVDVEEDQRIERKAAKYSERDLGDYFSMWANTPPSGGIIIVGVENNGSVSGISSVSVSHMNSLQRAGDIFCEDALYSCKMVGVINSKGKPDQVLAIRVQYRPDKVVETSKGKAFARRGGSIRELNDMERRELAITKGQIELESEPTSVAWPEEFNQTLLSQFIDSVRTERRFKTAEHTTEQILERRRLGKIKNGIFTPNLACALLFAKDPGVVVPGCRIHFMRFEGKDEKPAPNRNTIKSEWIEGTVSELVQQAEQVLKAQIREYARLGEDGRFVPSAEYPKDAWYEAVVNACVHRSYNLKTMHITIKMFDDRLEIESPGGFPALVTPENIYEMHVPRNPHLMDAMRFMKFVLCENEGTKRIRDSMQHLGLPSPTFKEIAATAAMVRLTLRNDVEHRQQFVDTDAFKVLGETLSKSLTPYERRLVNFVAEHASINVTEAQRIGPKRWQAAKKALMSLVERNILDHVHSKTVERDAHAYFILKKRFTDKLRG